MGQNDKITPFYLQSVCTQRRLKMILCKCVRNRSRTWSVLSRSSLRDQHTHTHSLTLYMRVCMIPHCDLWPHCAVICTVPVVASCNPFIRLGREAFILALPHNLLKPLGCIRHFIYIYVCVCVCVKWKYGFLKICICFHACCYSLCFPYFARLHSPWCNSIAGYVLFWHCCFCCAPLIIYIFWNCCQK